MDFVGISWGPLPKCVPLAKAVAGLKTEMDALCSELPHYQWCCSAQLGTYASLADSKCDITFQKTGEIHDRLYLIPVQTNIC